MSGTASADTLYAVNSSGDLYSINATGSDFAFTNLGAITGLPHGSTITDIAELNGELYLTTYTGLYVLSGDAATAVGSGYGSATSEMDALTFGANGILYGAADGTTGNTDYYTINTTTGVATAVATSPATEINAAGDLQVIGNTLYVTTGGTSGVTSLAAINLSTGSLTNLGTIETGSTTYDEVFGLAVANGNLYGFDAQNGDILNFGSVSGTITNSVTVVPSSDITGDTDLYGTTNNVVTSDPVAPEPATFGAMGFALLILGSLGHRRRKEECIGASEPRRPGPALFPQNAGKRKRNILQPEASPE